MPRKLRARLRLAWDQRRHWVAGAVVLITGHWAALATHALVDGVLHREGVHTLAVIDAAVYGGLFIVTMRWLYRLRAGFFAQPRTRYLHSEPAESRAHLVLFLSSLDERRGPYANGVPAGVKLTEDLAADLASLVIAKQGGAAPWPWEMALRGVSHHAATLQTVTLVCSRESIAQAQWFAEIVGRYRATRAVRMQVLTREADGSARVTECPCEPCSDGGWEFEDFDQLSTALRQLLARFSSQDIAEADVMIDFTGGQKVTSVVAATMTFNRRLRAQYVQTGTPHKVMSYDLVMEGAPTGIEL